MSKDIYVGPQGPKMVHPGEAPEPSPTVVRLREALQKAHEQITEQKQVNYHLRILVGSLVAGPYLYLEDGEIQDNSTEPHINFLTDSPEEIRQKLVERANKRGPSIS